MWRAITHLHAAPNGAEQLGMTSGYKHVAPPEQGS
jgi:hypothetical protein